MRARISSAALLVLLAPVNRALSLLMAIFQIVYATSGFDFKERAAPLRTRRAAAEPGYAV